MCRSWKCSWKSSKRVDYEHFMLKEIYEQPRSVRTPCAEDLRVDAGQVELGGIRDYVTKFVNAKRIIIVACGTSWHAGLGGRIPF